MDTTTGLSDADLDVLRRLGAKKAALAASAVNLERRDAWLAHDIGTNNRVMVLAEISGVRDPKRPVAKEHLECTGEWARAVEFKLRTELYQFEVLKDDHVIEPVMNVNWQVSFTGYGVETVFHQGGDETHMGSRTWEAPIKDLDADFHKLKPRTASVNREATLAQVARMEAVFQNILPTRIRGHFYWTMGMTWRAIDLIGLEELMLNMYDNPAGVHRLMAFLRDDHLAIADWLEDEGLYSLNNDNDYVGSGSMGYTRRLPQTDWTPDRKIRKSDLWVLSESQETVGVGPEQFEAFIFPYQHEIVRQFGRTYYGCCEPVNNRWHILKRIGNLARVSVSPWADEAFMAEALGRDYVYSRKPHPILVSTDTFDEPAIRADLRKTLTIARGCRVELIMKDVHTLHNEPDRLARWVALAREEIARHCVDG